MVASECLASNRIRSTGKDRAATWRLPPIGTLNNVCGAVTETALPLPRTARSMVRTVVGINPATSLTAARDTPHRVPVRDVRSDSCALDCAATGVGTDLSECGTCQGADMFRRWGSSLMLSRSSLIALAPSARAW